MVKAMSLCGLLLVSLPAAGQTVVSLELDDAILLLKSHQLEEGAWFLTNLANNYKKFTNVRVHAGWREESLATLARALRTDFDGSGIDYIPELTIWQVHGTTNASCYLIASLVDKNAVLISSNLAVMKAMVAAEILTRIKSGSLDLSTAKQYALAVGVYLQVKENTEQQGEFSISFYDHPGTGLSRAGKLQPIEPPDFTWD
jgi:hypothetical protein